MQGLYEKLLNGPLLGPVFATGAITLYWLIRIHATSSASYRELVDVLGAPGRLEKVWLGGLVVALNSLVAFRIWKLGG